MNGTTFAKAPKILPWLAHKAGIGDQRALTLWQTALRDAEHAHAPGSSDCWQAALARLNDLIVVESQCEDIASFGWRPWARNLAELWALRMDAYDGIALASLRTWRILGRNCRAPLTH